MAQTSETTVQQESGETGLLGIYLNDHLATFTLAVDLARRAAGGQQDPAAAARLRQVAGDLDQDRSALREVMRTLDVPVRQYKVLLARAAERIGRLKPNGHLLSRSPLSNLVEAEGLRAAIEANVACWHTLCELADTDPRLDVDRLRALLNRAQREGDVVAECRRQAAAQALIATTQQAVEPAPAAAPEEESRDDNLSVLDRAAAPVDPGPSPAHDELPLPDYDHLPTGSLAARIRALDRVGLDQLLAYERAHANRLQVVLILERRRDELTGGLTNP